MVAGSRPSAEIVRPSPSTDTTMGFLTRLDGRALLLAALSSLLGGCFLWTTRGEGNDLEEQVAAQDERIRNLEEGFRTERDQLQTEVQRARTQVAELEGVLDRATKVVTRNSADLGLEVEQLRGQIGSVDGRLAEIQQGMETLRRELTEQINQRASSRPSSGDPELSASDIPGTAEEHFAAAYRAYQARDLPRARALFRAYVTRYPQDDRADNAQYWVGATYLREERAANALAEFRKVVTDYPRGDAMDETLLDMAESFYRLHSCTDAKRALETMLRTQAGSPLAGRARDRLQQIEQAPQGYCTG